jgi:hypothetical protein
MSSYKLIKVKKVSCRFTDVWGWCWQDSKLKPTTEGPHVLLREEQGSCQDSEVKPAREVALTDC